MTYLGDVSGNRDNNFNLIRMIAALAVLVSHAWPIALGPGTPEPLHAVTGRTMGGLAVAAFFVISGFLIAASYERSRTRIRFVAARVLRLMPGLLVSLLLVALVMGPLVADRPLGAYLTDPGLWTFLARNLALVQPQYTLPGVFETNPYPTVEGSIWTLAHEVACYVGVFAVGVAGLLSRRGAMAVLLAAYLALWFAIPALGVELHPKLNALRGLSLPFALGTAFYLWQDRLPLNLPFGLTLVALAAVTKETAIYPLTLTLALGYGLFWLAYVPGGWIRAYNRLGDYSYGVYIYAFPAQGLAVWLFAPMTPWENIALALPITLVPSVLSWHFVEKPALAARGQVVSWLQPRIRPWQVRPDRRLQDEA